MSTNGPSPGVRSLVNQRRQRAQLLELEGYPGVSASPETVARLHSAHQLLSMGAAQEVTLNMGSGAQTYRIGDIELLLGLCAEAFERYDSATPV